MNFELNEQQLSIQKMAREFTEANCQVKCNTSAGEANRRHFLGL